MVSLKNNILYILLSLTSLGLTGCLGTEANTFSTAVSGSSVEDILLIDENNDDIEAGEEDESEEAIADENEEAEDGSIVDEEIDEDSGISDSDEEEVAEDNPVEEDPVEEPSIEDEDNIHCQHRGNIIRNGSFEVVDGRKGEHSNKELSSITESGWDVYKSLPSEDINEDSWVTTGGAGIEIQGDNVVTKSKHGLRKVELDSHNKDSNSSMAQKVYLCKGKYTLRFAYYPRTKNIDDNIITVKLDDKQIKSVNKTYTGQWHNMRRSFKIQKSGMYKLTFSAEGKENSLGGLVDHVRLHRKIRRAGVITSLLALGDMDNINSPLISSEASKAIVHKLVNYVSIKRKPNVLMVKDGNHNGESIHDYDLIHKILVEKYGDDKVKVISGSLSLEQALEADVLFVVNPGHPLGSKETADVVRKVIETGLIGVVLSGDDMARGAGFSLNDITGAKYTDNGVRACGVYMDNNKGTSYKVKLKKRFFRRLSSNERVLSYGNDIDHVEIEKKGVRVFAKSMTEACGEEVRYPTIFGYKLKKLEDSEIKEILSKE